MQILIPDHIGHSICQHQLDTTMSMSLTESDWDEFKVMALVTKMVHVMIEVTPLQVKKIEWLREDCPPILGHILYQAWENAF